jgi:hypothetical protein
MQRARTTFAAIMAQSKTTEPLAARDLAGLACLYTQLGASYWIVPDWSISHLGQPVHLAAIAGLATSALIAMLHLRGIRGSSIERTVLAVFLGGMPFVYVASWLVSPEPGWLGIELLGVAIFVPLAILGTTRSAWFLAGGIAAHGLLWDVWHHGRTTFVPDWYTIGCLVADLGIGLYTATQVPRFDGRDDGFVPVEPTSYARV